MSVQAHVIGNFTETHARSYMDEVARPGAWQGTSNLAGVTDDEWRQIFEVRALVRQFSHFFILRAHINGNIPSLQPASIKGMHRVAAQMYSNKSVHTAEARQGTIMRTSSSRFKTDFLTLHSETSSDALAVGRYAEAIQA